MKESELHETEHFCGCHGLCPYPSSYPSSHRPCTHQAGQGLCQVAYEIGIKALKGIWRSRSADEGVGEQREVKDEGEVDTKGEEEDTK